MDASVELQPSLQILDNVSQPGCFLGHQDEKLVEHLFRNRRWGTFVELGAAETWQFFFWTFWGWLHGNMGAFLGLRMC